MPANSLNAVRLEARNAVYERYKKLKEKGVGEQSARNIAAAQAATAPKARHRSAVYRRELDALLAPPKERPRYSAVPYQTDPPRTPGGHWRMPQ